MKEEEIGTKRCTKRQVNPNGIAAFELSHLSPPVSHSCIPLEPQMRPRTKPAHKGLLLDLQPGQSLSHLKAEQLHQIQHALKELNRFR